MLRLDCRRLETVAKQGVKTVTRSVDLIAVLCEMRKILARPESWIKGEYSTDNSGKYARFDDVSACVFDVIGALDRAVFNLNFENSDTLHRARRLLLEVVISNGFGGLVDFNDNSETTHDDVLALIEQSIIDYAAAFAACEDQAR